MKWHDIFQDVRLAGECKQDRLTEWLNAMNQAAIPFKNLRSGSDGILELTIQRKQLRTVVRLWHGRKHNKSSECNDEAIRKPAGKSGLKLLPNPHPLFSVFRTAGKPGVWACVLIFTLVFIYSQSLYWQVSVSGGSLETREQARQYLVAAGIHPFAKQKPQVSEDPYRIVSYLHAKMPSLSGISADIQGTRVMVQLEEIVKPKLIPGTQAEAGDRPSDLIAIRDAVVAEIRSGQGKTLVSRFQHVKKGQTLVSGITGSDQQPVLTGANGEVTGFNWYIVNVSLPQKAVQRTLTGSREQFVYWFVGTKTVGRPAGDGRLVRMRRMPFSAGGRQFPFGYMEEQRYEVKRQTVRLTKQETLRRASVLAGKQIRERHGSSVKVRLEKVLQVKWDHDKVNLTMLYELEERISEPRPAVWPPVSPQPQTERGQS